MGHQSTLSQAKPADHRHSVMREKVPVHKPEVSRTGILPVLVPVALRQGTGKMPVCLEICFHIPHVTE
jgi:hypothetical protein